MPFALIRKIGTGSAPPAVAAAFDSLSNFGTLPGVTVTRVGGLNGPGYGSLRAARDGTWIAWRAPRSETFGEPVHFLYSATRRLLDGENADKWIEIAVSPDYLPTKPVVATVRLADLFENPMGLGDVSSANAAAGLVSTDELTLTNESATAVADVTAWLDPRTSRYDLSFDGATWASPTDETAGLAAFGAVSIAGSGTQALHIRRTVASSSASASRELVIVYVSFNDGAGGRAMTVARGLYRIANAPEYRFYRTSGGGLPQSGDAAFAVAASLPNSPAATFADATHNVSAAYFNGYLVSGFRRFERMVVSAGALTADPPADPLAVRVRRSGASAVTIEAEYATLSEVENDALAADTWRIWYTTNGAAPNPAAAPTATEAMYFEGGVAKLRYSVTALAAGTTVKAIVKAYRTAATVASPDATIYSVVTPSAGPLAPGDGSNQSGHL